MEENINQNKKIKVCFFSPASYPFFKWDSGAAHGGAELQMYLLAKCISKNQAFEILFLAVNYGQEKNKTQHNIQLIRTIQLKQKENILSKVLKAIKYFFQLIQLKPDILISTNANALAGISAFYAKLFNKKYIYRTSHLIDVNTEYINTNGLSGKLYKYGLINADKVITQNVEHQILLKENHGIDAEIIKNLVEIVEFPDSGKKHILWVGRFQNWKRPELFLKFAKDLPEKYFVMICPYSSPNKKLWEKLRNSASKISNLEFIEKIPFYFIQKYFNKAELFVNTSDYEGFPNTFLQAALAKTPIISLNVNPDNFITKYDCGIFAEGDFSKMLNETENLLNNTEKRKFKGENLFRYLKENHDFDKNGKKFKAVIENTL